MRVAVLAVVVVALSAYLCSCVELVGPKGCINNGQSASDTILSYLVGGNGRSVFDVPSANVMLVVHGIENIGQLPITQEVVKAQPVFLIEQTTLPEVLTTSRGCIVDVPHSAHVALSTSPECLECLTPKTALPADKIISWTHETGFAGLELDVMAVVSSLHQSISVSEGLVRVTLPDEELPVIFDLSVPAHAAILTECALLASGTVGTLVSPNPAPLPAVVYVGLHGIHQVMQMHGADSLQVRAAVHMLDVAASQGIPKLEAVHAHTAVEVLLMGDKCNCECAAPAPEPEDATARQTLALRTVLRATETDDTTDDVDVGGAQILIWLTVALIALVLLSAYLMVGVGIDATKDTLLYFKTTTYH
ncbi:hypothetical protein Pelo_9446 [Pelomyxa schiedti]|nr:hypothetical protein Pelo_9446 [Pelomyxa schiedti]